MSKLDTGRWRVRWRERVRAPDGSTKSVQRERVVESEATAIVLRSKVLRALETGELFEPEAVREAPPVCSVDELLSGYLRSKAAAGVSTATLKNYTSRSARILEMLRAHLDIEKGAGVPASALGRNTVIALTLRLREAGLGDSTVRGTIEALARAWEWGCDDPETYPGLPAAPRVMSAILPAAPLYLPTRAPTLAECDAVLRVLASRNQAHRVALPSATIARCTGLRVGQILSIRLRDLDIARATLTVATGKSKREKAERRVVPLAPVLLETLRELAADGSPDDLLIRTRRAGVVDPAHSRPHDALRVAWEAATEAGEVRRETWAPENRIHTRPDHAFRAGFQEHLVRTGIRDECIDLLVGHATGLRGKHYLSDDARWEAMTAAVATIPPIDWQGPGVLEAPDNVVELKPRG